MFTLRQHTEQLPPGWIRRLAAVQPVVHQIGDDRGIGQRRHVTKLLMLVGRDLAQDATHDLAGACLGQRRRPLDQVRRGDRADLLAHPLSQLGAQRLAGLVAGFQGDVGIDRLTLDIVRIADTGRFGDLGMRHQRAFDLGGADTVAGDVDHVVDPAGDPVIAVGVAARAVAGEILALEGREIGLDEALMVAEHRAHLAGPGVAIFRPSVLMNCRQERHLAFQWDGQRIAKVYDYSARDDSEHVIIR